jgi:hypothetical protein
MGVVAVIIALVSTIALRALVAVVTLSVSLGT